MKEIIANIHMHTTYSDGSGRYEDLWRAAIRAGVDVLIVTDHNVLVQGCEGYYKDGKKKVLILIGEEVHDQDRVPQKNHLLAMNIDKEMATLADDPQILINSVIEDGGLCFIAHPVDPAMPAFNETDISWVDWDVTGFTGLEVWNGLSELKSVAHKKWQAVLYAFFPAFIPHFPLPETLARWDDLTAKGKPIVAIGGSDAHSAEYRLGVLHKTIFPYAYHYSSINTHILLPGALTNNHLRDRQIIYDSLRQGHCFIGYDSLSPTRGFRFTAAGKEEKIIQGDEITMNAAVTLQVKSPAPGNIRLIKNGAQVKAEYSDTLLYIAEEPGVYRVEIHKRYLGKMRGWIFSNPIYLR